MKIHKLQLLIAFVSVSFTLAGCGLSSEASATATVEASLPAIGHWSGTVDNKQNEYISFDIDEQRNIVNFTFDVTIYGNKCRGTIDKIIVSNLTFSLIMDQIQIVNNQLFMGEFEGRFTHEKMDGTINILACGASVFGDNTWAMSASLEQD